ncbi:MAG TPA: sigma-70 family RNA polymerase sigma factor [Chitinophaga sp.]|uniref:sigma-70 family RNA polymerase sigma factor n=1 Tax=Chitinophaga sp. TaxID=1869181 RepID=UPI002DBFC6FF|nr:sigma-70 family RNA polymerase sigma factor [Chitinophaga sp.]HEU4551589.1 sigma-70 family RNA polymerase sigma factor [Chitinophaga sp.]
MYQQLNNLSDKELISRARKLKDREAEGVLLERYSHLMVAVCLPYLKKDAGAGTQTVFPQLLQRLSNGLKVQSIQKANEWVHQTIKTYFTNPDKQVPYYPSRESKDRLQTENRVEKAATNTIERQQLITHVHQALSKLGTDDRYIMEQFYLEHKTFADLAAQKGTTVEKIRQQLKKAKSRLATQLTN